MSAEKTAAEEALIVAALARPMAWRAWFDATQSGSVEQMNAAGDAICEVDSRYFDALAAVAKERGHG